VVSDTTARQQRDEWIHAGVFDGIAHEALAGYDKVIRLDLSDVAIDGSTHNAPVGGEGTGKSPVDRDKLGWKWSIATDRGQGKSSKTSSMGLRWPVERTNSWLSNYGQMRRNTDRRTSYRLSQLALAIAVILTATDRLAEPLDPGTIAYPLSL
jgi:hypothetical protein